MEHVDAHLEVRDDIILDGLIIESIQQDLITVAFTNGIGNASDEVEQLIGKVFVEVRLKASLVEDVGKRSEASLFFIELASVANVQEAFEVAERDSWNDVSSSATLMGCSLAYHASHTFHHLSACGSESTSAVEPAMITSVRFTSAYM
jgi:glycyl-tRNA synthetase alpha subunit